MIAAGQRFGRLLVLAFEVRGKHRHAVCRCDCGARRSVRLNNLENGETVSCGCYARDVSKTRERLVTPEAVRFRRFVDSSGGPDACWPWTGARRGSGNGYGVFVRADASHVQAHRFAWEQMHGPVPAGMFVCHRCDNPPCCNPAHIFVGSPKDNSQDMVKKGRCKRRRRQPPPTPPEEGSRA